jgi:hypothetical protein
VHLAHPRDTEDRRRRWTRWTVALTATLTVCGAQQTGLSSSADTFFSAAACAVFAGSVRPEQKATPMLAPFRASTESLACRKQPIDLPRPFHADTCELGSALPAKPIDILSCQSIAGESTRGPPRMDPPSFC